MTEMVGLTCRVGAHNSRYAHDTRLYPKCNSPCVDTTGFFADDARERMK